MKADLHIHSNFSDGSSSPEEIVDKAIEKGLDCICVSDHQEVEGAIRAMKYAFDKNILVIPGIEILTFSGEILGINVRKVIPDGLSAEETVKQIRNQKGLVVIPHPFHWPGYHFRGGEEKILSLFPDAVEIFNASVFYSFVNKKALDLSRKNNLAFTAGSDAHRAEFVGRAYLEIDRNVSSEKEFLEEIKKGEGRVGGTALSRLELFRNFSKSDVRKIIKSCFLGARKNI